MANHALVQKKLGLKDPNRTLLLIPLKYNKSISTSALNLALSKTSIPVISQIELQVISHYIQQETLKQDLFPIALYGHR